MAASFQDYITNLSQSSTCLQTSNSSKTQPRCLGRMCRLFWRCTMKQPLSARGCELPGGLGHRTALFRCGKGATLGNLFYYVSDDVLIQIRERRGIVRIAAEHMYCGSTCCMPCSACMRVQHMGNGSGSRQGPRFPSHIRYIIYNISLRLNPPKAIMACWLLPIAAPHWPQWGHGCHAAWPAK